MTEAEKIVKPEICQEEHLTYLDDLRESGITNMFGAAPYLAQNFGLTNQASREILVYWMKTFKQRHPR